MMLAHAMTDGDDALAGVLAAPTAHRLDLGDHLVFMSFRPEPFGTVVAFESAPPPDAGDTAARRAALGEAAILNAGYNAILLLPKSRTWYRTPDIREFFQGLADSGALDAFRPLYGLGDGMGGFGALSFAEALDFEAVLAIGGPSTLHPAKAPLAHWALRADPTRAAELRRDWTGPGHDGAREAVWTPSLTAIFDPLDPASRRCAERLSELRADGASLLRAPGLGGPMGEGIGASLRRLGLWEAVVSGFLSNRLTGRAFHRWVRRRRSDPEWIKTLQTHPRIAERPRLAAAVIRHAAAPTPRPRPTPQAQRRLLRVVGLERRADF